MKTSLVFLVLTAALLTVMQVEAQPKKSKSSPVKTELKFADTPVWYVHYNLLITGSGGKVINDGGGGQTVTWTIKRRYSGDFKLELERQRKQAAETAKALKNIKLPPGIVLPPEAQKVLGNLADQTEGILWLDPLTSPPIAAYAEINDERTSVFVDRGGEAGVGKCRESNTETWTFNGQVIRAGSYASFTAKSDDDSARVVFGFAPTRSAGDVPVRFTSRVEGDCSQDAKETGTTIKGIKISEISVPEFEKLIVGQGVDFDLPKGTISYENDSWQFTSEAVPVSAEIGGFPESKGEVAAILYLKFSKSPPVHTK